MASRSVFSATLLVAGAIAVPVSPAAQTPGPLGQPGESAAVERTIRVIGVGRVTVPPDHAVVVFGVDVHEDTPQRAAAEMDRRLAAVADTLATLGFPADSLPNTRYDIRPARAVGADPGIRGYFAGASLRVRLPEMARLTEIIDAAVSAGATTVGDVGFGSSRESEARGRAMELAVRHARGNAERLAAAAGLRLGPLIDVTSSPGRATGARLAGIENMPPPPGTAPITPRRVELEERVVVAWRLTGGAGVREQGPAVTVTGTGEVGLPPDRAVIQFGVDVEGTTALDAARAMGGRLTSVADTLIALGFPRDSLPTVGFRVAPQRTYGQQPGIRGYQATSSIRVDVDRPDRLPEIIGAVLGAGATTVGRLSFTVDPGPDLEGDLLEAALRDARQSAERLAAAAGMRLGSALSITSNELREPGPGAAGLVLRGSAPSAVAQAPITPPITTLATSIRVRWALEP